MPSQGVRWETILAAIVVTCVSWWCYFNSIHNEFVFDDDLAIVRNADVSGNTAWSVLWGHDIWGKDLLAHDSHRSYRPLLICIFKFIFENFGLYPPSFRIVSIFLHNIMSFLVYLVSDAVFGNPAMAFSTAVLFASHPVHVESVAAVVNMAEALSGIFYLLGFYLFCISVSNFRIGSTALSCVWCFVCLCISVLFKETGITLCGLILFHCAVNLLKYISIRNRSFLHSIRTWVAVHWAWIYFCVFGVGTYIIFRLTLVGMDPQELVLSILHLDYQRFLGSFSKAYLGESQLIRRAENPFAFLETRTEKVLSYMYLHYRYFLLLVMPTEQCAEYAYDCIPKVTSSEDPRNMLSFGLYFGLAIIAVVGLALIFICRSVRSNEIGDSIDSSDDDVAKEKVASDAEFSSDQPNSTILYFPLSSKERFWSFDSSSMIISLAWLVVPFLPMSGAFLKLGTLLAERLLYIPSIGWCMLLSLLLHSLIGILYTIASFIKSRFIKSRSISATDAISEFQIFPRFLFFLLIAIISWKYSSLTVEYNTHWKDSEALFVHGLSVCPNSAKLNLQVAKIYVNRGEYAKGKVYVDRAGKIDPEFCDVGYQRALITLFHDEDIEGALTIAIDNLGCPFSNVGSLELITKLMDLQLSQSPRDHHTLAKHGDLFYRGNMTSMAIQKYQSAVTIAFEMGAYKEAISYSLKAENAIQGVLSETSLQQWQDHRINKAKNRMYALHYADGITGVETATQRIGREHACFVDMLGGGVRAHINHAFETATDKKRFKKIGKPEKFQLNRRKELLFRAIQPSCLIFHPFTGRLQSSHAEKAVNLLSGILVNEFNQQSAGKTPENYNLETVEEFAYFGYTASQVYLQLANITALSVNKDGGDYYVKNDKNDFDQEESVLNYKTKAIDLAQTTIQMWSIAGKLHFYNSNYANSSYYFGLGLQWGMASDEEGGAIGAPCNLLYWKAHALAATEAFLKDDNERIEIIALLERFISCKPTNQEPSIKKYASKARAQISKLKSFTVDSNGTSTSST